MFAAQKGACAICHRTDRPLNIDHCHDSGKVRGLLCANDQRGCNHAVRFLEDDVTLLQSAIDYLLGA